MAMVMRTTVLVLPEVPSQLYILNEKRGTYTVMFVTTTVAMIVVMFPRVVY